MNPDGVTVHLTERESRIAVEGLLVNSYEASGEEKDTFRELAWKIRNARIDALAGDDTQAGE